MSLKARISSLMHEVIQNSNKCPFHSTGRCVNSTNTISDKYDYAFEMSYSTIRYGPGVTKELGMDVRNFKSNKVLLITDKNVATIPTFKVALDSLKRQNVNFEVYDEVQIEPTDTSIMKAVSFARSHSVPFDLFIAFGGGSVMDTCKLVNLLASDHEGSLEDYMLPPYGKNKSISVPLKPMIALPTTSGTGSETTDIAVFDLLSRKSKVGISQRQLKPTLGLVDPNHAAYLPREVACYSGFDVMCHALESYTAIPYNRRSPRPENPNQRPRYQGSNPVSDVWAQHAITIIQKYFIRSVNDPTDTEARNNMHLAASVAGMGFGNAGVHLCHGMSYPISGLSTKYQPNRKDYKPVNGSDKSLIPHGLSVIITAPAVFQYVYPICSDRQKNAVKILDPTKLQSKIDIDTALADVIRKYMMDLKIPDGLTALGFDQNDIPNLVQGTLSNKRVLQITPMPVVADDLKTIFSNSMKVY